MLASAVQRKWSDARIICKWMTAVEDEHMSSFGHWPGVPSPQNTVMFPPSASRRIAWQSERALADVRHLIFTCQAFTHNHFRYGRLFTSRTDTMGAGNVAGRPSFCCALLLLSSFRYCQSGDGPSQSAIGGLKECNFLSLSCYHCCPGVCSTKHQHPQKTNPQTRRQAPRCAFIKEHHIQPSFI